MLSSPSLPAPSSTSPCRIFSKKIGRLPSLQSSLSFCFLRCRTSCVVILLTLSYFMRFHTSCAATLTALLHAPFYDLAVFYDSLLLSPGLWIIWCPLIIAPTIPISARQAQKLCHLNLFFISISPFLSMVPNLVRFVKSKMVSDRWLHRSHHSIRL